MTNSPEPGRREPYDFGYLLKETVVARPKHCRRIEAVPNCTLFKPAGIPARSVAEIILTVDEFEALRLADHQGLYQEQAAGEMNVSRQTFGRIVESARKKVAQALVEGCVLRIEGGKIEMPEVRVFECAECGHAWEVPFGTGRPPGCPTCQSDDFHRAEERESSPPGEDGGGGRRRRHGKGGHGRGGRGQRGSQSRAVIEAPAAETGKETT